MEKVQLSFNCRTSGERVIERSTLINIRTDTVNEGVALYQELLRRLGDGAMISEHEYLPQIPARVPQRQLPATSVAIVEPESTGKCPRCGAGLILRTAKKGLNAGSQFWSCGAFYSKGCLFTKPS